MNNKEYELTNKHKSNIAMRVVVLILLLSLCSLVFKALGSDIFNKFIENQIFIDASNFIDSNYIANIATYSLLGFIITYFTTAIACKKLCLKWWQFFVVLIFSIGMAVVRDTYFGVITYAFDLLQYIIFPMVISLIFYKRNLLEVIMLVLITYFVFNGFLFINKTLCDLASVMYLRHLIAYILCFIEPYLFIIAYAIFVIKGDKNG